jgi:hypothetical protein
VDGIQADLQGMDAADDAACLLRDKQASLWT